MSGKRRQPRRRVACGRVGAIAVLLVALVQQLPVAAQAPGSTATSDPFDGFDRFVQSVMEEWQVPGLAVAAVQDGEVVLSRGYGYRNVEEKLPVTPRTLFAIGSNTKSFTATMLGMLVDDGKLAWDTPVQEYLPDFRLHSDVATDQMTPEDLVTHRSGLPRHDLLWYGSELSREQLFHRLRYLEPSEPFRSEYQYQNLMFMTAGYLAGKITGTSWEELVDERILTPLGMERTNFSVEEMPKSDDFAYPYAMRDSQVVRIPFRNLDAIGPAGSINSSVEEMVHYIQFHIAGGVGGGLQGGVVTDGGTGESAVSRGKMGGAGGSESGRADGNRLLSEANARAMQRPQMAMSGDPQDPELGHSTYGLGLVVGSYRGHKLVRHGGGIDGFISSMAWLPKDSIGVMVLTNFSGNNPVPGIVTWNVFDRLLGLQEVDWAGRIKERQAEDEESDEEPEGEDEEDRVEGTSPTHALADYAGRYEHPAYGALIIEAGDPSLAYRFYGFDGDLEHWHYDLFQAAEEEGNPLSEAKLVFGYDKKGDIDRLLVSLDPNVDDIVFERAPDESMKDPAFLSRLTGEYELGPTTAEVALRGETLVVSVAGQPARTLVPDRGTSFDLEGLSGFWVEFTLPESGPATEMTVHQPNGIFTAKRKE